VSPSIAVITPPGSAPVTPLLPARTAKRATEWEWYHRCLSAVGEVSYFDLSEWQNASGFDVVLVHEGIDLASAEPTLPILVRLANRNGKLIWVEPHHRTTFSASVFDPRFFDAVDLVAKYQLMDYPALVDGLRSPENNLAPWPFYGHSSLGDYYADRKLFALPTSPETFQRHLSSDLSERYGSAIVPMMRLFTLPAPTSWYGGSPTRQLNVLKESQVGIPLGEWSAPSTRGMIAGLIAQTGLDVKIHGSKVRAAATSEACVAIGPAHLDGGAADVLRFETLAILPEDPRYLIWDDVFVPYESYLPLRGFGQLLRRGGRMINGEAAHRLYTQLADDLSNTALRERILQGQRRAYELLTDPTFIAAKLGVETRAPAAAPPTPAPRRPVVIPSAAPARIGSISTDEISVVIQGAIGRDDLPEQVVESARRHLPGAEVVLSTWEGERALELAVDRRLESVDPGASWQIHEEWPCNTNRLLVSTRAGLEACTRPLALKLRSDTPLTGTGFLQAFKRYPARATALRLLRDRMIVINYYCWNPDSRPYGLFSVADTVNFGWSDDVRRVWDRPLDEEPANSTWFESHPRPKPDLSPWAGFQTPLSSCCGSGF
jgi:hypothetical protein